MEEFLEIINPLPGYHILEVTTKSGDFTRALYQHIQGFDAELYVAQYPGEHEDVSDLENIHIQIIPKYNAPFRATPRSQDIIVFNNIFTQHPSLQRVLKIAYTALANNSNIIIVEDRATMTKSVEEIDRKSVV